jgi:hypothetical protein
MDDIASSGAVDAPVRDGQDFLARGNESTKSGVIAA